MKKFFLIVLLSCSCFGSSHEDMRTKANVMSLGMALRARFYPHVDAKELKMILRHTGQPDDQNFIFAKYRISLEAYKEMEEIESIASIIETGASLDLLDDEQLKKAKWLSSQYLAITLYNCSFSLKP